MIWFKWGGTWREVGVLWLIVSVIIGVWAIFWFKWESRSVLRNIKDVVTISVLGGLLLVVGGGLLYVVPWKLVGEVILYLLIASMITGLIWVVGRPILRIMLARPPSKDGAVMAWARRWQAEMSPWDTVGYIWIIILVIFQVFLWKQSFE